MSKSIWSIRCVWCERVVGEDWAEAERHWDACRAKKALKLNLKAEWRAWFRGTEGARD